MSVLEIAEKQGLRVEERPMLDTEARLADELFITSTTREISWVSHWDNHRVRTNTAGEVTMQLHRALKDRIAAR